MPIVEKALAFATKLHEGQFRKPEEQKIPYITHPKAVAEIVAKYTDDEDVIAAAILHDTIEDCDYTMDEMRREFGERVSQIVADVSEDVELKRLDGTKASWLERKQKYLNHLAGASAEAMLVSAADKTHNLRSMIEAYKLVGEKLWGYFNSPPDRKLWFYEEVLRIVKEKYPDGIEKELEKALADMKTIIVENKK